MISGYKSPDKRGSMTKNPTQNHEEFMRMAIQASRDAVKHGNRPFGAVLVKDGKVLMKAENEATTKRDCTLHAELNLVSQASRTFDAETLAGCILYTSTEPCPMCAGSIYCSGIPTMVFGCADETLLKYYDKKITFSSRIILGETTGVEVIGPVLEKEAEAVHRAFIKDHNYNERRK